MLKILGLVLVSALLATGAGAEWILRRPSAGDDQDSAFAVNAQGHRLDVGCGNGGFIDISLTPDTRPAELKFVGEGAVLYFQVDGAPGLQMPATCGAQGCTQDFMLGGEPWPVSQMQAITSALRSGSRLDVLLGGSDVAL
tara:strand:+ start:771 stop:1190 length:420 start_codon:yes stop_codon:yes gene_type:complete